MDLTTHTSLSPIRCGFVPSFVNYKKKCTRLAAASDINYVACPGSVILSTTKTGRHDIAESGVKHQNSNNNQYNYIFIWIFKNLFLFTGYVTDKTGSNRKKKSGVSNKLECYRWHPDHEQPHSTSVNIRIRSILQETISWKTFTKDLFPKLKNYKIKLKKERISEQCPEFVNFFLQKRPILRGKIVLMTLFSKIALCNRSCMHYNKDTHKLKTQKVTDFIPYVYKELKLYSPWFYTLRLQTVKALFTLILYLTFTNS